jgi:hypothetical protein
MPDEPTVVALRIRKLKSGAYHDWKRARYDPTDPDALWRQGSTAPFVEKIGTDGAYEVLEVVTPESRPVGAPGE